MFCAFFKQGLCKKGDKCKFSHDPAVERKSAKRNIYLDEKTEKENDLMDDWDEEKLQEVIDKKHGAEKTNQTDIVRSRFYLSSEQGVPYLGDLRGIKVVISWVLLYKGGGGRNQMLGEGRAKRLGTLAKEQGWPRRGPRAIFGLQRLF